jgi:hypothetical protein
MTKRMAFTVGELCEMRRALQLAMQEDASCGVNMGPQSVADKEAALAKITKVTGRSLAERMLDGAVSVRLEDIGNGDRPFGGAAALQEHRLMAAVGLRVVHVPSERHGTVEGEHPLHSGVLVRLDGDGGQSLLPVRELAPEGVWT